MSVDLTLLAILLQGKQADLPAGTSKVIAM